MGTYPELGFNPCFDGSVARACADFLTCAWSEGFNPCFDGSVAREANFRAITGKTLLFQSLF